MKIGELVKNYIDKIFQYCETRDRDELFRLMDKSYSKEKFNINFPFCKEYNQIMKDEEYVRFWKKDYSIRNKDLRVCSQWVITSKDLFLNYLLEKNIISLDEFNHLNKIVQAENPRSKGRSKYTDPQRNKPLPEILNNITSDELLQKEAIEMSNYYSLFYALERSIRKMISDSMQKRYGENWWENAIHFSIKESAEKMKENEMDTPHSKRSDNNIDYTSFIQLKNIILANWKIFEVRFNKNKNSIDEILTDINRLRWPIAHSSPLATKEIQRLELRLDDWFSALKE